MTIATRIGRSSSCKIGVVRKKSGQSSVALVVATRVSQNTKENETSKSDLKPQTSRLPPFERGHMHTRVCLNDGRPNARLAPFARLHRASRPLHRYPSLSEVWARCGALSGGGGVSCFSNYIGVIVPTRKRKESLKRRHNRARVPCERTASFSSTFPTEPSGGTRPRNRSSRSIAP